MPWILSTVTLGDIFFYSQGRFQSGRQCQQQKQLQWCFWQEAQLPLLASAAFRVFITSTQDKRGIEFRHAMAVKRLSSQSTWEKPSGNSQLYWLKKKKNWGRKQFLLSIEGCGFTNPSQPLMVMSIPRLEWLVKQRSHTYHTHQHLHPLV